MKKKEEDSSLSSSFSRWINQAERDLKTSKNDLKSEDYHACLFWIQQAAEKALKAVLIYDSLGLIKTHDLILLARKCKAPRNIIEMCALLNPFYTMTRYPDVTYEELDLEELEENINYAQQILEWCKKRIRI
jgi:HEPN domain-containing protein